MLVATATLLSDSPGAFADPLLDEQPAVRQKLQYFEGRHSLAPMFGMTLNDPYMRNIMGGITYRYYAASWLGIGFNLAAGTGLETGLTEDINQELSALSSNQTFSLSTSTLRLVADATLELIPLEGKFMLFGAYPVRIDLHLEVGFGVAMVSGSGRIEDSVSIMPSAGVGVRMFPERWLAVGIDLRHLLVNRALASYRDGSVPAESFESNWLLGLSVGFFLPAEPEVSP